MKFEVEKAFARDFRKIKNREPALAISETIEQVSEASNIKEIANLRKLTGHRSAFRIRIGDYRIGVIIEKVLSTLSHLPIEKKSTNVSPNHT